MATKVIMLKEYGETKRKEFLDKEAQDLKCFLLDNGFRQAKLGDSETEVFILDFSRVISEVRINSHQVRIEDYSPLLPRPEITLYDLNIYSVKYIIDKIKKSCIKNIDLLYSES